MSDWSEWTGRTVTQADLIDSALVSRWMAAFDKPQDPSIALPQGLHFCLCTPEASTNVLGEDGHPKRRNDPDGIYPAIPLPRRMWAASSIAFLKPLKPAQRIERISTVESITEKEGSSGKLAFLELSHLWRSEGVDTIREKQTLVYREAAALDAPLSPPESASAEFDHGAWDASTTFTPSEALLFRFSALTFNTHRIHYDLPYARDVERYRGLVVHGPLIASKLMQFAAETYGDNALASFDFRAVSPAIAGEQLHLAMRNTSEGLELGCFTSDGRQTLKAAATLA